MAEPGKSAAPVPLSPESEAAEQALRPSPFLERWHKPVFILCLLCWVGNLVLSALRIDHSRFGAGAFCGLCKGLLDLANPKDGPRLVHCALGEFLGLVCNRAGNSNILAAVADQQATGQTAHRLSSIGPLADAQSLDRPRQ